MFLLIAPDTLVRWFYTNAPAAWISALIAIASLLFVLRSRKKPNRLVVREVRNTSLVTVWPTVRDEIQMSFSGKEIDSLGQVELEIRNEGSDVVKDAKISVSFPAKCKVLSTLIEPQELGARSLVDKNVIYIVLPYVNPYDVHKQTIKTSILVDGNASSIQTTGTGEGWSLRYSALPTEKQTRRRLRIAMGMFGTWWIALFPYGRFLERKFGLSAYELSWRSLFLNGVPNLLALMLILAVAGLFPSKSLRMKG